MMLYARDLNLLALGEESAQALGVDVPRLRLGLLALASLLTASAVSIAGPMRLLRGTAPHVRESHEWARLSPSRK